MQCLYIKENRTEVKSIYSLPKPNRELEFSFCKKDKMNKNLYLHIKLNYCLEFFPYFDHQFIAFSLIS